MNLKLALAGALLAFGFATPALAAPGSWDDRPFERDHRGDRDDRRFDRDHRHGGWGQWELVGSQQVSFRTERDTIYVRGHERHRQLKICVYNRPVRMLDMDVRFRNGGHQDVGVRHVIGAGECTRAIDLDGRRRDIRSVSFIYKTVGGYRHIGRFPQHAFVRVYAR